MNYFRNINCKHYSSPGCRSSRQIEVVELEGLKTMEGQKAYATPKRYVGSNWSLEREGAVFVRLRAGKTILDKKRVSQYRKDIEKPLK